MALIAPEEGYVVDPDSGAPVQLFRSVLPYKTAWSPDGDILAVTESDLGDDGGRIEFIAKDGSTAHPTVELPGHPNAPVWSQDGGSLGLSVDTANGEYVFVLPVPGDPVYLDGISWATSAPSGFASVAGWLPDGRLLATVGAADEAPLYAYDIHSAVRSIIGAVPAGATSTAFVSPDGTRLAIAASAVSGLCPGGADTIRVVDLARMSSDSYPADGACDTFGPIWSPDGSTLAYGVASQSSGDDAGLYLLDLSTGTRRRIMTGATAPVSWLDSGSLIVRPLGCYYCDGGYPSDLVVTTDGDTLASPTWDRTAVSPSGRVAGIADGTLHVTAADATGDTAIASVGSGEAFRYSQWLPGGKMLMYTVGPADGVSTYTMRTDGSGLRRTGFYSGGDTPSPDGSRIAWTDPVAGEAYVGDPGRGNAVQLSITGFPSGIVWSPDSSRFVVSVHAQGSPAAWYVVGADGTVASQLATQPGDDGPVWSPDGRFVAFWGTELRVVEVDSGSAWMVADGEPGVRKLGRQRDTGVRPHRAGSDFPRCLSVAL